MVGSSSNFLLKHPTFKLEAGFHLLPPSPRHPVAMVGWTGKDYKFDFDVGGFFKTSVVYFGMAATAFYVIRVRGNHFFQSFSLSLFPFK